MAETKTKPTRASVAGYLAARGNAQQRADCRALIAMLKRVTKQPPKMWGPSIVGFGKYKYVYSSGHSGEAPLVGFAIRGRELVLYVDVEGAKQQALRAKLGKHSMGKVCLYMKQLADVDLAVLEQIVRGSIASMKKKYGKFD